MIKTAEFVKSVSSVRDYIEEAEKSDIPEIAVAGKSNVGKSSFINMLTGRKKLAKTSSTPGRTRLINLFDINGGGFLLVDLPGYGYAQASREEIEKFSRLTDGYFKESKRLAHVFSLVDIRHNPTALDVQMVNYLYEAGISFTIIATKADKLSRAQQDRRLSEIAAAFKTGKGNIIPVSSETGQGKNEAEARIRQILAAPPVQEEEQ